MIKKLAVFVILFCIMSISYLNATNFKTSIGGASTVQVKTDSQNLPGLRKSILRPQSYTVSKNKLPIDKAPDPISVNPIKTTILTSCGDCTFTDPDIKCIALNKDETKYIGGYYMKAKESSTGSILLWYNRLKDYTHDLYSLSPSNYLYFTSISSDVINPSDCSNCPRIDVSYCGVDPSDPGRVFFGMKFYEDQYFPFFSGVVMESSITPIVGDFSPPIKALYCKAPAETVNFTFNYRVFDLNDLDIDYSFYIRNGLHETTEYSGSLTSGRPETLSVSVPDGSYFWRIEAYHDGFTEYYPLDPVADNEMSKGFMGSFEVRSYPEVLVTPASGTILHPGDVIHVEIRNAASFLVYYYGSADNWVRVENDYANPLEVYSYDIVVEEEDLNVGILSLSIRADSGSHTIGLPSCTFSKHYSYSAPFEVSAILSREISDESGSSFPPMYDYVCRINVSNECETCGASITTDMSLILRKPHDEDIIIGLGEWEDHVIGSTEISHEVSGSIITSLLSGYGLDEYSISILCDVRGASDDGYYSGALDSYEIENFDSPDDHDTDDYTDH